MTSLRQRIRRAEIERCHSFLPGGLRVLEIGGANGYQAMILREWGNEVESVDVDVPEALYHPVKIYDGRVLPFADKTFDVVYSSNVLEHVPEVQALLREAARVLRDTGSMVHVLPSSSWRFWTNVAHYAWVVWSVILRHDNPEGPPWTRPRSPLSVRNILRFLYLVGIPHSHGVYHDAVSEIFYYSVARWRRVFQRVGLRVDHVLPAGVFYSGYKVLGTLDVPARRQLALILGSSCNIFVMRKDRLQNPALAA